MEPQRDTRLSRQPRHTVARSLVTRFRTVLETEGLYDALGLLNATADFRFTGVYRFEGEHVMNVVLFDRQNPGLRVGEDVRLDESYCRITAEVGGGFMFADAHAEERLGDHAARDTVRSYCAVLLETPTGEPLGTLCHFDILPRAVMDEHFEHLEAVRRDVERAIRENEGLPPRDPEPRIWDLG